MNKIRFAALAVAAVLSAGVICITACDGGAGGEKVTEEEWKAAFAELEEMENVTADYSTENYYEWKTTAQHHLGLGAVTDGYYRTTEAGTLYAGADGGYRCAKFGEAGKNFMSGMVPLADGQEDSIVFEGEFDNSSDYEGYYTADGNTRYLCVKNDESDWRVLTGYSYDLDSFIRTSYAAVAIFDSLWTDEFATETRTEEYRGETYEYQADVTEYDGLAALYSAFTYKKGVYSANLYNGRYEWHNLYSVKLTFSSGHIASFSCVYTDTDYNYGVQSGEYSKSVYTYSLSITFTDINSTADPVLSDGAQSALDKYKSGS